MQNPTGKTPADRTPDATSDKTLKDIEETKKTSADEHENSTPSPDGQFDEAPEREKAEPM